MFYQLGHVTTLPFRYLRLVDKKVNVTLFWLRLMLLPDIIWLVWECAGLKNSIIWDSSLDFIISFVVIYGTRIKLTELGM